MLREWEVNLMWNFIKDKVWILEPKYELFYINASKNAIRIDTFPKITIRLEIRRENGICLKNGNSVLLKEGDIIKITIQNTDMTFKMSVDECAAAISVKCFIYNSNREFEEIQECNSNKYIRLY